jgi:hypothetical protein
VNAVLTGVFDGSRVTLRVYMGVGANTRWAGELDGSRLTMHYPGKNGVLATIELASGEMPAFDAAVERLRAGADPG